MLCASTLKILAKLSARHSVPRAALQSRNFTSLHSYKHGTEGKKESLKECLPETRDKHRV